MNTTPLAQSRSGSCCGWGLRAPPPSRGKRGGKTLRLDQLDRCIDVVGFNDECHLVQLFYLLSCIKYVMIDDAAPCGNVFNELGSSNVCRSIMGP